MSTGNPSSANRPRVRLERDINADETFFASNTIEIYRREQRTTAEIDGDRDGSLTYVQTNSTASHFVKA